MTADFRRLPPQNIEAEAAVLGAVLVNKEAMDKVADLLTDDDFYRQDHQTIFRATLRLYERQAPIDLVTLTNELEALGTLDNVGGAAYLAALVNSVPTALHVTHYAEIVRHKSVLRKILAAGTKIAELGYEEEREVGEILDDAEAALFGVSRKLVKDNFQPISDILAESFDRIDRLHREKGLLRGVPTGFRELDNKLSGLQPSDLIILAARPSIGKTTLALNIALNAAVKAKVPVGFFSLEQSKEQIVDRLLCAQAMVDGWKLRTGNLSEDDFPAIGVAMGVLAEAPIYIDDSPVLTPTEIRTRARRLLAENKLGLIVVDYLQMLEGRRSGYSEANRVQEVSEISRSLKALARELNVPVVALSQLSRAVESRDKKIPQLSDLRESGCLAGSTRVILTDSGERVAIRDLVGRTNVLVWSMDDNFKLVSRLVTRIFSSGYKQVFELRFRSGRQIKASANHRFRTYDDWVRLDELRIGQKLALPRTYPSLETDSPAYSDDGLILFAHMVGDGCYVPRQPIHYTNADRQNVLAVQQAARRLLGIQGRIVEQENWYHLYLPSPYRLTHRRYHPFRLWLREHGLDFSHSYDKKLPEDLFTCSTRQIKLFLHHLWATDGCVSLKNDRIAVYYSTTSEILASQIQHLLLRLGIQSRQSKIRQIKHGRRFRDGHIVEIQGKDNQERFIDLVGCFGQRGERLKRISQLLKSKVANPNTDTFDSSIWSSLIEPAKVRSGLSWREFSAGIETAYCGSSLFASGLSRTRLAKVAEVTQDRELSNLAASDIYWDEIVAITPQGVEEVYDLTVPGTHNFVANDIIVHNSIEQDADVVMFLYREDYYDKESPRKGITDVLIRKHRNGPIGEVELHFRAEQARFYDIERKAKVAPD